MPRWSIPSIHILGFSLAGCVVAAGQDFTRPPADVLILGKTTARRRKPFPVPEDILALFDSAAATPSPAVSRSMADGTIHPVRGVLPMALGASRAGLDGCLLSTGNTSEASVLEALSVYPVGSLAEAAAFLDAVHATSPCKRQSRLPFRRRADGPEPRRTHVRPWPRGLEADRSVPGRRF